MELNKFADLNDEDLNFVLKPDFLDLQGRVLKITNLVNDSVPPSMDWRTKGVLNPIRNQDICGACWAFSVVS